MKRNRIIAGAATIAVLAGGSAAIAATTDKKAEETAVLTDAAKRLGVSADELKAAISGAEDAQLAAAVKAGKITQAQADEIAARRKAEGTVLNLGHGGGPGRGGHGGGGRELLGDAATALGISEDTLMTQLRDGKKLADVAKANGKTLSDVKAAVKKAATARLAADLKAGKITQSQYDERVGHLDDEISRLGDGRGPGGRGDRGGPPPQPAPSATATP